MFQKQNMRAKRALDEAIDRVLHRGESVESCLARFPDVAEEIEPLLRTAVHATAPAQALQPSSQGREAARHRMLAAVTSRNAELAARAASAAARPTPWGRIGAWQAPRWALATAATAAVLVTLGALGAVAADSMPTSPFYQLKGAAESVQLTAVGTLASDAAELELLQRLADERVGELAWFVQEGKLTDAVSAVDAHAALLAKITERVEREDKGGLWGPGSIKVSVVGRTTREPPQTAATPDPDRTLTPHQQSLLAQLKLFAERQHTQSQARLKEALHFAPLRMVPELEPIIARLLNNLRTLATEAAE